MEITGILIIRGLISLVTFGGLLWAFIIHLSSRQSKSHFLTFGYFVGCVATAHEVGYNGNLLSMNFWTLMLWLISFGEVVRFYDREKMFDAFLQYRSDDKLKKYSFDDFKAMSLGEEVRKSGGRIIQKVEDTGDRIVLDVTYEEQQEFIVEATDYDFTVILKDGYINMDVLGKNYGLLGSGDRQMVKMKHPIKIDILAPSTVRIILSKRA